jgi:hypothetical protein
MSGIRLHELGRFTNHSFAKGDTAIEGIEDCGRSLQDNSAKDVAFLGDTPRRAGGDLVLKPEPKDELIKASLAVLLQQLDSRDHGCSRERHWAHQIAPRSGLLISMPEDPSRCRS